MLYCLHAHQRGRGHPVPALDHVGGGHTHRPHHRSPGSRPKPRRIAIADIKAIVFSSGEVLPYLRLLLRTGNGETIQLLRDYRDGEKRVRFFRTVLTSWLAKRVGVTLEG